jgi:phosphoglycerate dehydrogenase-like enzyme
MAELLILSRHAEAYARLVTPHVRSLVATANPDEALRAGGEYKILLGEPSLICQALPHLGRIAWVQSTWAGVEPLLGEGGRRDYTLTNVRGVFGPQMSEYVFGYLLAHERRILQRWQSQQAGQWDPTPPGSLHGKTLGLLGVGSIGVHIARTARLFGMRVRGYTRQSEDCRWVQAYYHGDALHAFAQGLDYLAAVLPNTASTRHIVDAALLSQLPPHAVFINAGRGRTVDEPALAAALSSGALAGAVLDVFEEEPLPAGHVFWQTPNLLITSHTAALSWPEEIAVLFLRNYQRYRRGLPLLYLVDFERGY